MYCPTCLDLGRFLVPTTDDWVSGITYQPETPIAPRGAFNPWELERTREVFLAEEQAWKTILPLQAEFRSAYALLQSLMVQYNALVDEVSGLMGPTGLQKMGQTAMFIPLPIFSAFSLFTNVFGGLFGGNKKQKKAQQLVAQIQALQARITVLQNRLYAIQQLVSGLVQVGERIRATQTTRISTETAASEASYQQQQLTDAVRGAALQERNRQVALMPRTRQGGDNVL